MKINIYNLVTLFIFLYASSAAQPILTASGVTPVIGDAFKVKYATTTAFNIPTAGGANVTWDYSKIVDSIFVQTSNYISPVGLPKTDSFPGATIAAYDAANSLVAYLNPTSSSLGLMGEYFFGANSSFNRFSPQRTLYFFPSTYLNSYTDSFTYINPSFTAGFTVIGYDTLLIDGYGTLKLPNGSYDNVLRQKIVTTLKYYYVTVAKPVLTVSQTNFEFGLNGFHGPLLELTSNSTNPNVWGADYFAGFPLPIEISNLHVSWQNQKPYVEWNAASTENTNKYIIQRSNDGYTFTDLGSVEVKGVSSYHFIDDHEPSNTAYYRIKQLDKDGKTFYSNICTLEANNQTVTCKIFPNPSNGVVHVSVPTGNLVSIVIYDITGKLVYENNAYKSNSIITTNSWVKGSYLVRIKDNNGWQVITFNKQ